MLDISDFIRVFFTELDGVFDSPKPITNFTVKENSLEGRIPFATGAGRIDEKVDLGYSTKDKSFDYLIFNQLQKKNKNDSNDSSDW